MRVLRQGGVARRRAAVGGAAMLLAVCATAFVPSALRAQPAAGAPRDTTGVAVMAEAEGALLEVLNVKDADLRDVFRGIAQQHRLNLIVDNRIDRRVTVRLAGVPVTDAIAFLCRENGLRFTRRHGILRVEMPPAAPAAPAPPPRVYVQDSLLTADLRGEALGVVVRHIAQAGEVNIVVRQGVDGPLTGRLRGVPLEVGLRTLLGLNGFALRRQEGIFFVDRAGAGADGPAGGGLWMQVQDSLLTLDVSGAAIAAVLREAAAQMQVGLVTYGVPEGQITARASRLTFEAVLGLLFRGTDVTYRKEGDVYFIGDRGTSGITAARLLRLDHLRADAALALVPEELGARAQLQVVKEHNGLLVTGTHDVIADLERFVREIDYPTPQILIEAVVVDFEATDLFELGAAFGRDPEEAALRAHPRYRFGEGDDFDGGFEHEGDGRRADDYLARLSSLAGLFGVQKIGRLPADFYFKLYALSREGKANIRSRPQVSTLNGHAASISIGTTQYYILRTATPYPSPGQVVVQETERFERIEANVKLDVTPWVSASGEVTAEIRPEFSMPVGAFTPGIPPTINSRVLESTVRLQDGETIILGGLIQEGETVVHNKVPLLGSLPLLGRLFRSTSRDRSKTELVIFLTPHVFYGDERDAAKWDDLQRRLELSGGGVLPGAPR